MVKVDWSKVLTSKTIYLGVLMVLAAIIEYIAGLPPDTSAVQAISGILTIIIRFLTKDAVVSRTGPPPEP